MVADQPSFVGRNTQTDVATQRHKAVLRGPQSLGSGEILQLMSVAESAKRVYDEDLRSHLEQEHKDDFVASLSLWN